jgi:FkbM family methyltransferase
VVRRGPAAGLRINPSSSNLGYALGTTEPAVQAFLAEHLRPGDIFYDIGANVGFFSILGARLVTERGHVYAFEPLPANAEALRCNVALNGLGQVRIIEAAVADVTGTAELCVGSSPLDAHLPRSPAKRTEQPTIAVDVVSIDHLANDRQVLAPSLVKIDAEGAETKVLQGMAGVLETHRPIVLCEIHEQGPPQDLMDLFRAALGSSASGYRVDFLPGEGTADEIWAPHAVAVPA